MTGMPYRERTTPQSEMRRMRQAFVDACAAIYAWPDPAEAWQNTTELQDLLKNLLGESADFRGYLAAYIKDYRRWSDQQVADYLGISRPNITSLISRARQRGNPITMPADAPILPPLILCIITTDKGILVEQRKDRIPPWTFPATDAQPGETAHDAAIRCVLSETGLTVTDTEQVGWARVHPKTARYCIYVKTTVSGTDARLVDTEDLDAVKWAKPGDLIADMPDMYEPVRHYLATWQEPES
jgi:ADP-ribose pyrophosphatase YjhB (NUDIX family)